MSTVAKFFVVLNLLLAVAFLGAASTFLSYVDSYRKKLGDEEERHNATKGEMQRQKADYENRLTEAVNAKNASDNAKSTAEGARDRLATAYAGMKEQYDILNSAQQKAISALVVAQKTIQDATESNKTLTQEHTKLLEAANAANDAKNAAVKAQHALEGNLSNAQEQIQDLQAKLTTTSEELRQVSFRLSGILASNPGLGEGAAQPAQEGKVLAVDNNANVVVISLGAEDGVKAGFRYTVSRGSSYVTTIEITDVEAKKSAGRALPNMSKDKMNVADNIWTAR